jgi:hypothetical protein
VVGLLSPPPLLLLLLWLLAARFPSSGLASVAAAAMSACGPAKHSSSGRSGCACPNSRSGLRHVALRSGSGMELAFRLPRTCTRQLHAAACRASPHMLPGEQHA